MLCWLHGPVEEIPEGATAPLEREEIAVADESVDDDALLSIRGLKTYYSDPRQLRPADPRARSRPREGGRRRLARPAQGRGARARRRVRQRQDDARADAARARPGDRGQRRVRRARHHEDVRARAPRAPPAPADHLPGPARVAEPGDDDRAVGRAPARHPPRREGGRAPPPGRGGARDGRAVAARAVHGQVPVRPLRRAEAAGGDRAGDHPQPAAPRRRRARLDARHERPGEDPRADADCSRSSSASPTSTSPTTSRRRSSSATASRSCTWAGSSRSGRPRRSTPTRSTRTRRRCCGRSRSPIRPGACRATCRRARCRTRRSPPLGCSFHPRCPSAFEVCGWESRDVRELLEERWAHMAEEQYVAERALVGDLGVLDEPVDARAAQGRRAGPARDDAGRVSPRSRSGRASAGLPQRTGGPRSSCTSPSSRGCSRSTTSRSSATCTTRTPSPRRRDVAPGRCRGEACLAPTSNRRYAARPARSRSASRRLSA